LALAQLKRSDTIITSAREIFNWIYLCWYSNS